MIINNSKICMQPRFYHFIIFPVLMLCFAYSPAIAQDIETKSVKEKNRVDKRLEEVVILGSRRRVDRSATDVPAPVDVFQGAELKNQANLDMAESLRTLVPSFNVSAHAISGTSSSFRPINLRGLATDKTLILVNGKRRHRVADIPNFSGGINDGAQGADISAIPAVAVKRVEVLRDGAAAQYGSDAIAGVINFVLNDEVEGGYLEAKYGSYYEGDGDTVELAGTYGIELGNTGFINLSANFREVDETSRSVQRSDAAALRAAGNTDVADPAQIWGSPEIRDDFKTFVNMAVDAGDNREVYAFGNWSERETEGGFFFRNPNTRGGVYSNDGGVTRLVGDMTPQDGITCPGGINFATGVIDDPLVIGSATEEATLAQISADPNCFVFNEILPGGFTPRFGSEQTDVSGAMGIRGGDPDGFTYDVSIYAGRHSVTYSLQDSVNASLGADSFTEWENLGTRTQLEKSFNADFVYPVPISAFASPLNIAFGFEWRRDQFEIDVAQPEAFEVGVLATPFNGFVQGFSVGTNGYSAYSPQIAGIFARRNTAYYLDLEAEITEKLLLSTAVRYEDFSDFGDETNYKVSALYNFTKSFGLRSTYSTGFHAPTPAQSNISIVSTVVDADGELVTNGTIPPTNPLAVRSGGKQLQPETSENISAGLIFENDHLSITLDYFHIDMEDRITLSRFVSLTAAEAAALEAQGFTGASDFRNFRFFTNDFSSTTEGVDLVASVPFNFSDEGTTLLSLAANWTDTQVTSFDPNDPNELLDERRVDQLENNLPESRANLTLSHTHDSWRAYIRVNYFDSFIEYQADAASLKVEGDSQVTVDIEGALTFLDRYEFIIGAQNVFDSYPNDNPIASVLGAEYPVSGPNGFNGGFYYAKFRVNL